MQNNNSHFKSGYVAIVGRPNVGKSTLTNAILKFPLSIITPKAQTTRHRILGIHTEEHAQIIFLDTPGLIEPRYRLQEWMMKAAKSALNDADIILFLVEANAKPATKDGDILETLRSHNYKMILVINKIDTLDKRKILPLIDAYQKIYNFVDIVPISALLGDNLDDLKKSILENLPGGVPFFPEDMITERPERFFVCELVREQIFYNFSEELPFSTAVVIDEFREREGHKDYIKARIIVERQSQKKIIIGKGGQAIRKIGQNARQEIEKFLGRPVYLELFVAVREKWRKKDIFLKEFGYDL
ncbi:GTPase Era [candidate division KSB1 bacterium]|nr:GTPase Era [candidate division KSB1 bacterium]RQW05014.1 MAG: GTPase Era [candidate division KSB1 bacterium]